MCLSKSSMDSSQYQCITLLLLKIVIAFGVGALLLVPTSIDRADLDGKPEKFEMSFKSVRLETKHYFCRSPEARAFQVSEKEVLDSLNLPNGTTIDEYLRRFGECRAKATKLKQDVDICSCNPRIVLFVVFLLAAISLLFNVIQVCRVAESPISIGGAWLRSFESMIWIAIASGMIVYQVAFVEDVVLPNSKNSQRYFKSVLNWWIIAGLAYAFSFVAIVEGAVMLHKAKKEKQRREDQERAECLKPYQENTDTECHYFPTGHSEPAAVLITYENPDSKEIRQLIQMREIVKPNLHVVTLMCKTWP